MRQVTLLARGSDDERTFRIERGNLEVCRQAAFIVDNSIS